MKYDIMDSRRSPVHVAYMRVGWEITNVRFPGPAWTRTDGNSMHDVHLKWFSAKFSIFWILPMSSNWKPSSTSYYLLFT